ncbi:hypothetical protein N9W89_04420 [Hellea sp.]|nr:hypothetical protein [Hellea sp.]
MVIQTCSEIFSVLMQGDAHTSFSAEVVDTLLKRSPDVGACLSPDVHETPSNDRTTLPHQK